MYVHFLPVLHSSHYGAVYRSTKVCGIGEHQPGWLGLAYKQNLRARVKFMRVTYFFLKKRLKDPRILKNLIEKSQ